MSIAEAITAKYRYGLNDEYTIREYGYTGDELDAEAARQGLISGGGGGGGDNIDTNYIISDAMIAAAGNYSTAGLFEYTIEGGRSRAILRSTMYHHDS
jgi:hypothetical protein